MSTNESIPVCNFENRPSRMGEKWDDDEVRKLLTSIQKKKTDIEIAKEHDRTPGAIHAQRKKLAIDYSFNDKRPIEEIVKFTGLPRAEVEYIIDRRTKMLANKGSINTVKPKPLEPQSDTKVIISLLKDIQSKLTLLVEKL